MGKLAFVLNFILSVFPADTSENRRHIHVVRRGSKKAHSGDTVAKIWIEENGIKKIDGVHDASVNFLTQKMMVDADDARFEAIMDEVVKVCRKVEPECVILR